MSTDPQWEQARELFLDLADLPADERERELAQLSSRNPELVSWVRELLRQDRKAPSTATAHAPKRFGPYEVVRSIGRGGMGEVFVARRVDGEYESEVAIKLLREGTANQELVRRFLRERQMLARLNHEYIARLLDGGTTASGEPYLVMEFVEGEPADIFAAQLSLKERIELFIRIGQAVTHAHDRGFVHRDLKPGNILVRPDGTPRLLDFGIARLDTPTQGSDLDDETLTRTGHRLFTPAYASPEQVRGEVATVRSDIFALGVVLYAFLCGRGPWPAGTKAQALEFNILALDPDPPSRQLGGTARARVSGDLDAIVMQCLAKQPQRRYTSVKELCEDLEAHLGGRPIRARRSTVFGRALRFARRKPAYPVGIAFCVLTLLALWLAWHSERSGQRRRTELTAAVSARIDAARLRRADGETETARRELNDAWVAVRELPGEKHLKARILAEQAVIANLEEEWDSGLELAQRARSLLEELDAPDERVMATALLAHGYALHRSDPGEESRAASLATMEFALKHLEAGDVLRVDALLGWADEQGRSGSREAAYQTVKQAVAETRLGDVKSDALSRLLNDQGVELAEMGRFEEAVECYREALEIVAWNHGERHPAFASVRLNLGTSLYRLDRLEESKTELERALVSFRDQDLDALAASSLHFLGRIHSDTGDWEAAEESILEAIDIHERNEAGLYTERSRCQLGIIFAHTERPEEARQVLEPILEFLPPGTLLLRMEAEARHCLGVILQDAGEAATARRHLSRALELKRERLDSTHPDCLDLTRRLARDD